MAESLIGLTNGGKVGAVPRASWWQRMRGKAGASDGSMIGVDIGATRTQVILLRRAEGTISLEKAASFPTSPEATTAGEFTNGFGRGRAAGRNLVGLRRQNLSRRRGGERRQDLLPNPPPRLLIPPSRSSRRFGAKWKAWRPMR